MILRRTLAIVMAVVMVGSYAVFDIQSVSAVEGAEESATESTEPSELTDAPNGTNGTDGTEGTEEESPVSVEDKIADLSLSGERIETDTDDYFTGDVTVNFTAHCSSGVKSVTLKVNGVEAVAKDYTASSEAVETPEGEVVNAESTVETSGEDSKSNSSSPITDISDMMVIPSKLLKSEESLDMAYSGHMILTDLNGGILTKDFEFHANITPEEKVETTAVKEIKALGATNPQVIDSTTYFVKVNKKCDVTTVYRKNSSGGYDPYKVMICSTARANKNTPVGTFKIGPAGKKCAKSKWALLTGGGAYAQYLVRFKNGICFHSVIYTTRNNNASMQIKTYNDLGTKKSGGCVRLRAVDAKWIYDNCPNGTKVQVYESSTPGPLGKPSIQKLSTAKGKYGWDPTDPDTGNPYFGGNGKATGKYLIFPDNPPAGGGSGSTSGGGSSASDKNTGPDIDNYDMMMSGSRFVYNGKVQTPTVRVKDLVEGKDFQCTYPSGRKYVGKYPIKINGMGDYCGTDTRTFIIVPQSTKIKKASGGKKYFRLSWNKVYKQISGYQICYSTSSNFKSNCRTIEKKSYKTTSAKVKTKYRKRSYYVKVRVYKMVGKDKYYSDWTSVKKVKVK